MTAEQWSEFWREGAERMREQLERDGLLRDAKPEHYWPPEAFDPRYGVLHVEKASAIIPVSIELALDSGAITEEEARAQGWTPPVYQPTPWHRKLRWRINDWRDVVALRLYRLVAGHDPEVRCDC